VTSLSRALAAWPALEGGSLPPPISYERGVWGKIPGSPSDYKWIATTPSFPGGDLHLEKQLLLGSEDAPRKATHWRSLGDLCLAMATYPSRSTDATGRSGFLEKQVFAWRRTETPAALGALALLPRIAQTDAGVWWDRSAQSWMSDDDTLVLFPQDHEPLDVSMESLEAAVETGLAELGRAVSEGALASLYAHLLAGHRAVPLTGLDAPLGPEALAVLLLPLPREVADSLSLAGWLPSQRIANPGEIRSCWNATLGGDSALTLAAVPAPEHQERGRKLARAVFSGNPARMSSRPSRVVPAPGQTPIQLALWGASAAGKTALLAQLYLANLGKRASEWDAYPAPRSGKFFKDMRMWISTSRKFPPASTLTPEPVEYRFLHRPTGVEVPLRLEDRAGSESSELSEPMRQHLIAANGLVLLFDPTTQGDALHGQVLSALESLNRDRTGKDPRPIAVCLSKADLLIETVEDLRRASEDPDGFVRRHEQMGLAALLDHYCSNYRFFPVSAAGVRVRYGVVESVVFYDNDLRPRIGPGGSPINVMAPFAWLLSEVTNAS
jgi:hypothetical protein